MFSYNNYFIIIITIIIIIIITIIIVRPRGIALVGGLPLALPLGTAKVTWLGHWELLVGTATALGVCPPPHPTLSMIFLCFPSPPFRRQPKKF